MKKNLLVLALLFAGVSLSAQTRFGLKTGLGLASVTTNDEEINDEKANLPTYQFGVVLDTRLSSSLSMQSQVLFLGKGTAVAHENHKDKIRFSSVDVPLQLVIKSKKGWFAGAGPNLGFNLSAQHIHEGEKEEIGIGSNAGEVKGFDFGITASGGYQAKGGFLISVSYVKGLSNLQNAANFEWQNNVFGINIGYMLPTRGKK
jgi:hypothetical protein